MTNSWRRRPLFVAVVGDEVALGVVVVVDAGLAGVEVGWL